MKYKILQNDKYGVDNVQEMILSNRGIANPEGYLNVSEKDIIHYSKLSNIKEAANVIIDAVENGLKFGLVCDSDFDGVVSSSMFYQYMKVAFNIECKYYIHDSKEHGLSKDILPTIISDIKNKDIEILVVVDAGTNDVEQCKQIKSLGCDVVIADHHEKSEDENKYAYIVNPMISPEYQNKYLSGSATIYKVLQQIDDINWTNFAENYLDLVAFSLIADSMDIRTFENRQLLNMGLSNVKNKFFLALLDKVKFSTKEEITPTTIGYYCSPLVNGLVRSGSTEEKELMFKAMCGMEEFTDYQKRDKTIIQESIYERVARLAVNAKSRQDRNVDKGIEIIEADIELNNRNKNKILFALATDDLDKNFTGLIAMKLASKYNKPVVLLREGNNGAMAGSARMFEGSSLTNFKDFLLSFGYLKYGLGHSSAFGLMVFKSNLPKLINETNKKLEDYSFEKFWEIDLVIDLEKQELDKEILEKIYDLRNYYGKGISKMYVLLKNIKVNTSSIQFLGKEIKDTWKVSMNNNLDIIKFKANENDVVYKKYYGKDFSWDDDIINIDAIVSISLNEWNSNKTWQYVIEEYEIIGE